MSAPNKDQRGRKCKLDFVDIYCHSKFLSLELEGIWCSTLGVARRERKNWIGGGGGKGKGSEEEAEGMGGG